MLKLLVNLRTWVQSRFSVPQRIDANPSYVGIEDRIGTDKRQSIYPYDEDLLERTRNQWQFGDWESLSQLEPDTLQHHPDRAKLALLAAASHLQLGNTQPAHQLIRLAQDWGCSKKLVSQVLIAGVHNSLGRAAAIVGDESRALLNFQSAISIGTPSSDSRLMTQARVGQQLSQLGLVYKPAKLKPASLEPKRRDRL